MKGYKLISEFPGMKQNLGTIFIKHEGWNSLGTTDGQMSTVWDEDTYFIPFIGTFFEIVEYEPKFKIIAYNDKGYNDEGYQELIIIANTPNEARELARKTYKLTDIVSIYPL